MPEPNPPQLTETQGTSGSPQPQPTPPTPRSRRLDLVRRLEANRQSRVITYICSDRQGAAANIGDDAVRPMYEHVRRIGKVPKLDLYLYSRGGAVEVPWKIVSMLREYCDELEIIVPYRAQSAATLIALGGDRILMGPKAELGPIDPALNRLSPQEGGTPVQEEIRVEDVMSFIAFIRDKAGLGDQEAIAQNVKVLAEKLSPWVLGSLYRTHSHIRMVARKMLLSHNERMEDQRVALIVEALAEKTYLHGHGIGRKEALDLNLPVVVPTAEEESAMWDLLVEYEAAMKMRLPVDPEAALGDTNDEMTDAAVVIAAIESTEGAWAFRGDLKMRRVRQAPPQININLNLNVGLPPGLQPNQIPQQIINNLLQQVQRDVPGMVQDQTRRQSPVLRVEGKLVSACWRDVTGEVT